MKIKAKPLIVEKWYNLQGSNVPAYGGRVLVIEFFQMHCRACDEFAMPILKELVQEINSDKVQFIGIHSVFEDHEKQNESELVKYLEKKGITFPVAIDKRLPGEWMPETMRSWHLQGTPSLVIIDQDQNLRVHHFGVIEKERLKKTINDIV